MSIFISQRVFELRISKVDQGSDVHFDSIFYFETKSNQLNQEIELLPIKQYTALDNLGTDKLALKSIKLFVANGPRADVEFDDLESKQKVLVPLAPH